MPLDHALTAILPPEIRPRDIDTWVSWHRNIKQDIDGYFDIANASRKPSLKGYNKTTKNIQFLLSEASKRGKQVRPFGGTWSFSRIAASPDWMVDTGYLNWVFHVDNSLRSDAYANDDDQLFFVQGGTQIAGLNRILEKKYGRSLNTTGASNGQTIAGACATGTHGSALDYGGIQNQIIGFHLITGPNSSVWVEKASAPATKPLFAEKIKADHRQDDELFNAALVGLGGLGFVAGVMVKTVPLFTLHMFRDWRPFDAASLSDPAAATGLAGVVGTLDFDGFNLPGAGNGTPYFFMPVINPYDFDKASVKVGYKKPYNGDPIDYAQKAKLLPGFELLGTIGALTDAVGAVDKLVNLMAKEHLKPLKPEGVTGTWGEIFDFTTPRSRALGSAVCVDLAHVPDILRILIDTQKQTKDAPLVFACRYVKATGATLEFTRFPQSCVIDIDGVDSDRARDYLDHAWDAVEQSGIPYTQHWGKINNYNALNVTKRFGSERVGRWKAARANLLSTDSERALFSSPFLERVGLA